MEDFVTFELAKKLKEKGFNIHRKNIIAMYNELGVFHTLTTSADYETCDSGYKCKCYYDYDYFDDKDYIAPTISQVLKWLREKEISIEPCATPYSYWYYMIKENGTIKVTYTGEDYNTYEEAALAGIEYTLENII